jgi:ribosomal-protein-alanine N-acetyltransferase
MLTKDLDAVAAIELKSNEFYVSREELIKTLRQRSVVGLVAIEDEVIVGFAIYELMNRRIQILDLIVHWQYRKRGIGSLLIERLKSKLSIKKRTKLVAELRESRLDTQLFLKAQGFMATEVMRAYFLDTGEDAYVFQYSIKED